MKQFFKLSDFLRVWVHGKWKYFTPPSKEILDHIVSGHFVPINLIRIAVGVAMKVGSCFRPEEHELSRGRDGSSQHTFKDNGYEGSIGATDFTFWYERHKTLSNFLKMCKEAAKHFDRVCFYGQELFCHGDYKSSQKQYFTAEYRFDDESQKWVANGWKYHSTKDAWLNAIEDEYKKFHSNE